MNYLQYLYLHNNEYRYNIPWQPKVLMYIPVYTPQVVIVSLYFFEIS